MKGNCSLCFWDCTSAHPARELSVSRALSRVLLFKYLFLCNCCLFVRPLVEVIEEFWRSEVRREGWSWLFHDFEWGLLIKLFATCSIVAVPVYVFLQGGVSVAQEDRGNRCRG